MKIEFYSAKSGRHLHNMDVSKEPKRGDIFEINHLHWTITKLECINNGFHPTIYIAGVTKGKIKDGIVKNTQYEALAQFCIQELNKKERK